MFNRGGEVLGTAGPPSAVQSVVLSPDETQLLAVVYRSWLFGIGQPGSLSLGKDQWMLWSPDGLSLIGNVIASGRLAQRSTNRSDEVNDLGVGGASLQDISPDGREALLIRDSGIFAFPLRRQEPEPSARTVVRTEEMIAGPGFSPDGRWIVYSVREAAGHPAGIYVQPYPGPGTRVQIASVKRISDLAKRRQGDCIR